MNLPWRHSAALLTILSVISCKDAATTGSLVVDVTGLPPSAQSAVVVRGPNTFVRPVLATTTLTDLPPGQYIVSIDTVHFGNSLYAGPAALTLTVSAGGTTTAAVPYALQTGSIDLTVGGLPAGAGPVVTITGPNYSRVVFTPGVVGELKPGTYSVRADTATTSDGERYGSSSGVQTVVVSKSVAPAPVAVAYTLASGTLSLVVNGLPASTTTQPVTVTGPGGFQRKANGSATYKGLNAGTYTIAAAAYNGSCPDTYTASTTQQTVSVAVGATTTATVSYTGAPQPAANLNFKIDGMHVVQVVQDYAGSVPLIASRAGLIRVFGVANQCNTSTPKVRVTLSSGTVFTIDAPETSVRSEVDASVLTSSWNVTIPAAALQPGVTLVAEMDPTNGVAEANESDNRFPATGSLALNVKTVAPVAIRFVPITQRNGQTGDVSVANVDGMMAFAKKVHPVSSFVVDVGPAFSVDTILQADGRGWGMALTALRAARAIDGKYHHGIVKVTYNSGVAGIGFIGDKAAMSWDYSNNSTIVAHELGHNYNRRHTPCGGPGGIDPDYPKGGFYNNGFIGVLGYDADDNTLKSPQVYTDVMGYCGNIWISDYTYKGMLDWLSTGPRVVSAPTSTAEQPGYLVWGRIIDGRPVLEPAFEISARPQLPKLAGPHRIAGTDANGTELFALSFAGDEIADLPERTEAFAFVVPRSMLHGKTLAALRLTARGGSDSNAPAADVAGDPALRLTRSSARMVRVRWDAARFPVVMVRDPASGQVLSFARGGDATINTTRNELELNYSNKVRSARQLLRVQQ